MRACPCTASPPLFRRTPPGYIPPFRFPDSLQRKQHVCFFFRCTILFFTRSPRPTRRICKDSGLRRCTSTRTRVPRRAMLWQRHSEEKPAAGAKKGARGRRRMSASAGNRVGVTDRRKTGCAATGETKADKNNHKNEMASGEDGNVRIKNSGSRAGRSGAEGGRGTRAFRTEGFQAAGTRRRERAVESGPRRRVGKRRGWIPGCRCRCWRCCSWLCCGVSFLSWPLCSAHRHGNRP